MLDDPHRTPALLRAVSKVVMPGHVVLDIGTGLGPLAIAAAQAGAERVWACDVDLPALEQARSAARRAGVHERIEFFHGLSFDLRLERRADVALCETVGSFGFDENILETIADAKRRLLKRGARIVPTSLELWGAPIGRLPRTKGPAEIALVKRQDLLSRPALICSVDLSGRIPKSVHAKTTFRATRSCTAKAVAVWPRAIWFGREISDASPLAAPTHWKQGILPLEPRGVEEGGVLGLELIIEPHPDNPLTMTERLWRWI